ncbi:MAG TPA: NAD(P)/FAD-dependent oxidoreductase [Acidimicrobiales bacterium]|nr:NAD(P)/FAD-dependent oxidoreductase [Acidimicrobiales bacterium]
MRRARGGGAAVVVGSGPNGLAAAIVLARAGVSVRVLEGADGPGGGCRSAALTRPGFVHDVCSAVHPLLVASPFFRTIDLGARGVRLCRTAVAFAHPLEGGRSAAVDTDLSSTAASLGADGARYTRTFGALVEHADDIVAALLAPLRSVPAHPLRAAPMALAGLQSAQRLAQRFSTEEARALVAGAAAHSMLPLHSAPTGAMARLFIVLAHAVGWPVVEGGSQRVVDALVAELESAGGDVECGHWVKSLDELSDASAVLLDVTPRQLVEMAGPRLSPSARRALGRYRYGPGICKVDYALAGPVPWSDARCREAITVHVGGTFEEVARSEAEVAAGRHPERPFCLVAQHGVADPTRAPAGQHTLWAYCHVPNGSDVDMTSRLEAQIERFAPGFSDLILERRTLTATQTEAYDPNYVGGDINAGASTLWQTVFRPTPRWNPYRTAIGGVYLCSAATPPGGGVHGLCGMHAARTVLRDLERGR